MIKLIVFTLLILWLCVTSSHGSSQRFTSDGPRTVVLYAVSWCHFCKDMKPVWERVKANAPSGITFTEIDGDAKKDPSVTGYPTIRMIDNGNTYQYPGGADYNKLYDWVMSVKPSLSQ